MMTSLRNSPSLRHHSSSLVTVIPPVAGGGGYVKYLHETETRLVTHSDAGNMNMIEKDDSDPTL